MKTAGVAIFTLGPRAHTARAMLQKPPTGRPAMDHRTILAGIFWVIRTGASWREVPAHFGPWQTLNTRYQRWRQVGMWPQILDALDQGCDVSAPVDHNQTARRDDMTLEEAAHVVEHSSRLVSTPVTCPKSTSRGRTSHGETRRGNGKSMSTTRSRRASSTTSSLRCRTISTTKWPTCWRPLNRCTRTAMTC